MVGHSDSAKLLANMLLFRRARRNLGPRQLILQPNSLCRGWERGSMRKTIGLNPKSRFTALIGLAAVPEGHETMRKLRILANFLLSVVWLVSASLIAQGQAPANSPRQVLGPAPPVPGPPHDPHDLTGVWNARRGYGGNTFGKQGPELTEWGQQQFKMAKPSNGGECTLKETNDPILAKCLPAGTPRIYLQPVPMQVVQTPKAILFFY